MGELQEEAATHRSEAALKHDALERLEERAATALESETARVAALADAHATAEARAADAHGRHRSAVERSTSEVSGAGSSSGGQGRAIVGLGVMWHNTATETCTVLQT